MIRDSENASPGRVERKRRQILLICLGLALATCIVFEPLRLNGFVDYDDDKYVTSNETIHAGLTRETVAWAWTTTYFSNWHPLTWLSHLLDVQLYGLNPAGHHLTSLLLHILNTLLLFGLLNRMTHRLWPSAFVAALFALHPLHVESVAWVSERKELLSTFIGLVVIWTYVGYARHGGIGRYLLTALFLALGLMAKPMLVTLPFVLLLLDYWPLERVSGGARPLGRLVLEKVPLLALSALSSLVTLQVQQGPLTQSAVISFPLRAANALMSYVRYLGKTIWPTDLVVLYQHPYLAGGTPWASWMLVAAAACLIALTLLALLARRQRYAIVGWLWFLGTLVPVIGLLQVGRQAMADRYTYLPLIGVFIVVAWGGADLILRWSSERALGRRRAATLALVILVACMVAARAQVGTWRDSETLFTHALEMNSSNPAMQYNLGVMLAAEDRHDEAISHYRRTLEMDPYYKKARNNLCAELRRQDRADAAIAQCREALRYNPDYAKAYANLGAALRLQGKLDEATEMLRQALFLDPVLSEPFFNLGMISVAKGRAQEATEHYRAAVRVSPDHALTHYNLAVALTSLGALDEAIQHYQDAVSADPDHAKSWNNLGVMSGSRGDVDGAMSHYQEAIRADPEFRDAHLNLGNLLLSQGKLDEGGRHYREFLRINPDNAHVHNNLGIVLVSQGNLEEAILHYREALKTEPDYADAHINLGVALVSRGELDEAIQHYRAALRLKPEHADAHNNLGNALSAQGKLDEAIQHYRRALEARPDHPNAQSNLEVALKLKSQPGHGQRIIQ